MASAVTQLNLEVDEDAVVSYLDETSGILIRDLCDSGLYWLVLHPASAPDDRYYARVTWTVYPGSPPSVRYADGIRGSVSINHAWPMAPGYRLGNFDICKPFTAEGFALHQDWQTGSSAWLPEGNPFLYIVQQLQFDLNHNYGGRNR